MERSTDAGAAAFDDLPAPVWELTGSGPVVVAANRAARHRLGVRVGAPTPGLDRSAAAQLAQVRHSGVPLRAGWAVEVAAVDVAAVPAGTAGRGGVQVGAGRVLLEVDLVPVERAGEPGVLVHAREVLATPAAAERDAAAALHGALLPALLPVLPEVDLAACYSPAVATGGGDWFDVLVTDTGRIAAVVGDVVGRGPRAAVAMSALLAVLRSALADGTDLAAALSRLDRHAARASGTRAATVAVALLDPATGACEHARCGHPPPVVRSAAGAVHVLDGPGGAPLGIGGPPPPVHRTVLEPGAALLLHTDGLVARPGAGLSGLVAATAGAGSPDADDLRADELCSAVVDALAAPGTDDMALLVVRRRPAPVPGLALEVPARAGELAGVRGRVTEWLTALDVTAETLAGVPLVVSELVSNAVEHAYRGRVRGPVRVTAALDGTGGVRAVVADDGGWLRPGDGGRGGGFGLAVVRGLADDVVIDAGPNGTRLTVTVPARRPAVVVPTARPLLRPVPDAALTVTDRGGVPRVIAVGGPVDGGTVDELRAAVLQLTGGGVRGVVIDLTTVTLLASAGVRLLHEVARFPAPPVVIAPAGSPSRRVLEVARLDHLLAEPA